MTSRSKPRPAARVVAVILVTDDSLVPVTAAAVASQVYEVVSVHVVGGGESGRVAAEAVGAMHHGTIERALEAMDTSISFLWILHDGGAPRPDALQALVTEAVRNEASIAGSKLVNASEPEILVSVGLATDVFDESYEGLDVDERDQGQYEVIRDVAAVGGGSVLMRRDLIQGLGGPDRTMSPSVASIDLCQRARLRGARVMIVPSSEVLYPPERREAPRWHDMASRIRAMARVYSPLTLLWALPLVFVVGLIEALVAPFLGRWTLFAFLRAWAWNIVKLPSTLRSRISVRRGRVVGDAELFRYQVRGSARLRALWIEISERLARRLPEESRFDLEGLGREFRRPAFVTSLVAIGFVIIATRVVWSGGLAPGGFSLGFGSDAVATLGRYAGGWNFAGFGAIEPLRPGVGAAAFLQFIVLGNADLARNGLVALAALSGVFGTARLLRGWGIESVPGLVAGLVLIAGPATRALTDSSHLFGFVALGILPWAVRSVVAEWPARWPRRIGRLATAGWLIGSVAVFSPLVGMVPLLVAVLWVLIGDIKAWPSLLVGIIGTALAAPLLLPWLGSADLEWFMESGITAYWEPGFVMAVAVGVTAIGVAVAAPRDMAAIGLVGGFAVAGGSIASRSAEFGFGSEVESAGLVIVAFGTALVVGAAFEVASRFEGLRPWRKSIGAVGILGAVVLASSTALVLAPGRVGFAASTLERDLRFITAQEIEPAGARTLLIGPADTLPGESRSLDGASYRVVSAGQVTIDEAWLSPPASGDLALESALRAIVDGETRRAGDALAPFGIRWIVALGPSPFEAVLSGQLDLVPLSGLRHPAFVSEATDAYRAATSASQVWLLEGSDYVGAPRPAGRTIIAENANARWGPGPWEQQDWRNVVAADEGRASFEPIQARRAQARNALALFGLLLVMSFAGRRFS